MKAELPPEVGVVVWLAAIVASSWAGFTVGSNANSASGTEQVDAERELASAEAEYVDGPSCQGQMREAILGNDAHDIGLDANMTGFVITTACGERANVFSGAEEAATDYQTVLTARDDLAQVLADREYTQGEQILYTLLGGVGVPLTAMGVLMAMGDEKH